MIPLVKLNCDTIQQTISHLSFSPGPSGSNQRPLPSLGSTRVRLQRESGCTASPISPASHSGGGAESSHPIVEHEIDLQVHLCTLMINVIDCACDMYI